MKLDKKLVLTICGVVAGAIALNFLLNNLGVVGGALATLWGLVFPFVLGLILAFLINIPMRALETKIFKDKRPKYRRIVSFTLTILLILLVVGLVTTIVVPQLVSTVSTLVSMMPTYIARIQTNLEPLIARIPELQTYIQSLNLNWENIGQSLFSLVGSGASNVLSSTLGVATSIISGATSFVIGLIFACYILFDKEHLTAQLEGLLRAYMPQKKYDSLMGVATLSNRTFSRFVSGQCTEAVAVCLMFLLVLWVGRFDYALLISVLIGFMSLIPILGAFIGCFVGAFLILVSSGFPRMVAFIIVFLIVQQIDGNVTYPRIVGSSIGLPPVWVLVAVTVGGGLMGIFGMLFFIPLASVLYTLLRKDALARLDTKGIESPVERISKDTPAKPKGALFRWLKKTAKKTGGDEEPPTEE